MGRLISFCGFPGNAGVSYMGDVVVDGDNLAHGSGLCLDLQAVLDNPISARQPLCAVAGVPAPVAHISPAPACRCTCRGTGKEPSVRR